LPLFKLDQTEKFLRFETAMAKGKIVDDKKEAPMMARVTDMETGELGEVILGTVLVSRLNEEYPDDKYVGRIFCLTKTAPEGTRKYSMFHITEVEEVADEQVKEVSDETVKPATGKARSKQAPPEV
jgi:hypothetical protein